MKRLQLALLAVCVIAPAGFARAGCTAENRGGSAGPYDTLHVAFGNAIIDAEQYGNSRTGPAYLCSDGSAGAEAAARGKLEISVDGLLVCASSQRLATDPFGFGAEVHSPEGAPCGADIVLNGLMFPFTPDAEDVHAGAEGGAVGLRKTTPATGTYWYGGSTFTVPEGATGYYTRGVRLASEQ